MEKTCPKWSDELKRGVLYRMPFTGAFSVRFDKSDLFYKMKKPILNPYVCMKCGHVELEIQRIELLHKKRVYL